VQGLGPHAVFVDASVWYSRTVRDWIGMLYTIPDAPPFTVFWTEDVMAEVLHGLRRRNPDWSGSRTTAIRDRLASTFEAGRLTDYAVDGTGRGAPAGLADGRLLSPERVAFWGQQSCKLTDDRTDASSTRQPPQSTDAMRCSIDDTLR